MEPARRQPDQHVALADPLGAEQGVLLHDAHAEAREVELVVGHHARVLGGLAPEERAPRAPASFGDPGDELRDLLGHDAAHGHVIEEEQRLRARAHDVVGAHRDEIDPDGRSPAGATRDLELGADPVGRRGEQPPLTDREEPGEPADDVGDLRSAGAGGKVGDQRDGLGGGLGVDTGAAVGVAHPVGSWS